MNKPTSEQLQEWLDQINASWSLEGHVMDTLDLANQRRIIRGEATTEEVLKELRRAYGLSGSANG